MKALKLMALATFLFSHSEAQTDKFLGVALHVTAGVKQVSIKSKFESDAAVPAAAFSLGGGSSWNIHRKVIGGEFYFSSASKATGGTVARYTGFNSNLYTGYQVVKTHGWQIAPLLGFGISKNQLLISSTERGYSLKAIQNAGYVLHTALRIERVSFKGNYIGLKLGYNISPVGNREWAFAGSKEHTGSSDDPGGFLVQLNVGGLIRLRKY
jgi:hypothetical protein